VAKVQVALAAVEDLAALTATHELPRDTTARVKKRLAQLEQFPLSGHALGSDWRGLRWLGGPWPWMLIVYAYDESADTVTVVTVQDARTSSAATHDWPGPDPP